jgi:hypothetical protein
MKSGDILGHEAELRPVATPISQEVRRRGVAF